MLGKVGESSKKQGLPRHPISPKGVLLRLKVRSSHVFETHKLSEHFFYCKKPCIQQGFFNTFEK